MRLPLTYYGNPILRKRAELISEVTDEMRQLINDMIETMDLDRGAGLAAPQIGRSIRLFVLRDPVMGEDGHYKYLTPRVFINPKITFHSPETECDMEGCLSIPGLRGEVERPFKITVEALDQHGKPFVEEAEGYKARIICHENDHLNGTLWIDRIDVHARRKLEPELRAIKKKYN